MAGSCRRTDERSCSQIGVGLLPRSMLCSLLMTPTLTLSLLCLLLSVSAQLFLGDGPVDVPAASCKTFEEMKDVRQMQLLWTVSLTTLCFAIFLVQLL